MIKEKIVEIITVTGGYLLFNKKPEAVTDDVVRKIYDLPADQPIKYVAQG